MDPKKEILEATLKELEKSFGKGVIMRLGEKGELKIPVFSSGSLSIDIAVGCGGFPKGRFIEIYGPESSGKTTIALHAISSAQAKGGTVAFIDAEHALDPIYAKNLGVDVDSLLISQPDYGEQALEIAEQLASTGAVDLIVIDSVAALVPKAEIEGDMGDMQIGLQARLMSQALRKLVSTISRTGTTIIFTNQLRQKVGVMFGSPETTTGGIALKFYASVRLDVRKIEVIKEGENPVGSRVKVKIAKNKVAPPFKEVELDIIYGKGINYEGELIDLGVEYGVIKKSGAWLSYNDEKLGQGREQAKSFLLENKDLEREIEVGIRKAAGIDTNILTHEVVWLKRQKIKETTKDESKETSTEVTETEEKISKRGKKN
ncbi:MAG: recombinase RecA [Candidatus Calescibacterium sp.]|nr:recombinase RecA [Candidatus Calescibacterium sp.]MCX7733422.1 recombinase RecA [bacterium]MDW8087551.1 recombinase RecA [Candidatus Calescibacterium sp.]